MRSAARVRRRVAAVSVLLSLAVVIAVEILGQGDPLFSPFTTFASGQHQGVTTIVVGVVLVSISFAVLAETAPRAILAILAVTLLYGGSFVVNTRLFDTYQLDRERHPSTWYFSTVLPLSVAVLGLVLGWLLAYGARGREWSALAFVLWVPLLFAPLFQVALANGANHAGWGIDRLTAFADAVTEAYEFALLLFVPLLLAMLLTLVLRHNFPRQKLMRLTLPHGETRE